VLTKGFGRHSFFYGVLYKSRKTDKKNLEKISRTIFIKIFVSRKFLESSIEFLSLERKGL